MAIFRVAFCSDDKCFFINVPISHSCRVTAGSTSKSTTTANNIRSLPTSLSPPHYHHPLLIALSFSSLSPSVMSSSSRSFSPTSPTPLQHAITPQEVSNALINDPVGIAPLAVKAPETTIPVAVYRSNRLLLGEIYDTILPRTGLNSRERQIPLAVLPSIPTDREAQLQRILGLGVNMLKALARIYETGLYAARNVGGGAKTSSGSNKRRSVDDTPLDTSETTKRPRFEIVLQDPLAESVAPESRSILCDEPAPLFPVEVEARYTSLLRALEIPNALPLTISGQSRFDRRQSVATSLLTRQDDTCPITGRRSISGALVAAHIVPHCSRVFKSALVYLLFNPLQFNRLCLRLLTLGSVVYIYTLVLRLSLALDLVFRNILSPP